MATNERKRLNPAVVALTQESVLRTLASAKEADRAGSLRVVARQGDLPADVPVDGSHISASSAKSRVPRVH